MGIILKPFAWLLLLFYNYFGYGVALMLFALIIKVVLFPVSLKGKKSMIQMNMLSGKMQKLQKQYGKDRERYNLEVQKLYEKEKVNPMGGCVWSLIPMVFLIVLYAIIREPLVYMMNVPSDMIKTVSEITGVANSGAYPQIAMAQALNDPAILEAVKAALGEAGKDVFAMDFSFLGMNLTQTPDIAFWKNLSWQSVGLVLLPVISALLSFLSMKVSMATNKLNNQVNNDTAEKTNRTMMYTMPLISLWIGFTLPAALCVYWIAQSIVMMAQEVLCGRLLKKDYEAARVAAAQRELEEKEEEKRRKEEARLERQRRIEEEKKNRGKKKAVKKDEPTEPGINKDDSRIGIRAYARGRSYDPNRFGGVTQYVDPSDLIAAEEAAKAAKAGKKGKKDKTQEQPAPAKTEEPKPLETPVESVKEEAAAPVEEAAAPQTAPQETEEVEVEVEQVEVELPENEDDKKEGV